MRLDKFLKVSRLIKRRTVAKDACGADRVSVNGKTVKPSYTVKEGDILEISYGSKGLKVRVLKIAEHIKAVDAATLYEVID